MNPQIKILMFGSCIARDIIEVGLEKGLLKLPRCFARSSIASLASPAAVDENLLARIASPFQQHCVRADMDKSFLQVLATEEFDIFLIDLAEERFALLETEQGNLLTLSDEYMAHLDSTPIQGTTIEPGSVPYYEKWHQGWYHIESILKQRNALSKVRILRFFMTNQINNGELIDKHRQYPFARQNNLLLSHYEFLERILPAECVINIPADLLLADPNHKWGLSPMHYIADMYHYALEHITNNKIQNTI